MKWEKSNYPGVRYREHPTNKHNQQKDRYFAIRYQKDGKRIEEGIGWASDGWSASKAAEELLALKKAARLGEGPIRLREKRQKEEERRQEEDRQLQEEARRAVTFAEFFDNEYWPSQGHKKQQTLLTEQSHLSQWLKPYLGKLPVAQITPFHLQRLQKAMHSAGRSPRTVQYVFATFRQVWNLARRRGFVQTDPPSASEEIKLPRVDNRRERYLTREEAEVLLAALREKTERTADMALLSLNTGMRLGEIAKLTGDCCNFNDDTIAVRDAKGGKSRFVVMTIQVREMLQRRVKEHGSGLLFTSRQGKIPPSSSQTFRMIANKLFNQGVKDPKQKVTFHTLRHTYASWLVIAGTPLYTVQRLLGHSSISMTERYSHLAPENSKAAAAIIENGGNL